ncbi:MAG TPA: M14 family metallopeptidase [Gemmatimonadaceae bacterium]
MRATIRRSSLLAPLVAALAACGAPQSRTPAPVGPRGDAEPPRPVPRGGAYKPDLSKMRAVTRPERTGFRETSSHADVLAFIDTLQAMDLPFTRGVMGRSSAGRDIPYMVLSRPRVNTPADARRLNRPIVYVQGNIHGGEVEGKEALQSLARDLLTDRELNVLDSLVLIFVPIYNVDGNEKLGPQERNRPEQNGPELVGERTTGDQLDLNRDYIKAEAAETKAFLRFLNAWNPDAFVDLHTTDGTFHGYAVTYSPPLHPASLVSGPYVRDTLLPELRRNLRSTRRMETFDYGNVEVRDSVRGWYTYDYRPRYGTNYMGVRGRASVLVEAFSHDPFRERVANMYTFTYDLLSIFAEAGFDLMDLASESDRRVTGWGTLPPSSPPVPLRAGFTPAATREPVLLEDLVPTGDSSRTEPGVPRGQRRTGKVQRVTLPIFDRFTATRSRPLPYAWAFPPGHDAALDLLRLHGVIVERSDAPLEVEVERFTVDTITRNTRVFQGHRETRLEGRWNRLPRQVLPAGTLVVRAGQPLAILAAQLLEAESADGLVSWNVLDPGLTVGREFPIVRVLQPVVGRLTRVAP